MSKLPTKLDNPLDIYLIACADRISVPLHRMGITPNMVTTVSLVLGLLAAYSLHQQHYELAAVLSFLAYFLDCLDGHMARKYKQFTNFGDWYDHIADMIKLITLLGIMYKIDKRKFYRVIPIIIIFAVMQSIHLGCQERVYDNTKQSMSLSLTKKLCPGDPHEQIKYTRYVGCGTFSVVLMLCILYFKP